MFRIQKRLVGSFAKAKLTGMRAFMVELSEPLINIVLNVLKGKIEFLSKQNGITFILHSPVKAFTNTVCLRVIGLSSGVINILNTQIKLKSVMLGFPTVFSASVS